MEKYRKIRKELNLTQEDVACGMGIHVQTVANIESGTSSMIKQLEYVKYIKSLHTSQKVKEFNTIVSQLNNDMLVITCNDDMSMIYTHCNYKYYDIRYNHVINRFIIFQKPVVKESCDEMKKELKELEAAIDALNC